ncbi:MarR family transcriptional regulator [Roseateles sp.]|uniref:MarR family winged helix-turn-helix transcriptional regulator n=1 Tax=Roseateles sp. TaxID=1971397 RepID=UPI00286CC54A|nr:MarR family transcriptional regulator [Roseateles sp.]
MRNNPAKPAAPQSTADEWLRLDRQLCFALYASSLAMTKQYKPLLAALGLTYPQYLVMLLLWEQDGVSVSSLGQRLSLDSGTLTPLLKRLEVNGLISRRRGVDDERRVDIFLSEAGDTLRVLARQIPPQMACATACSLEELQSLTQRLHHLRQQLTLSPVPSLINP